MEQLRGSLGSVDKLSAPDIPSLKRDGLSAFTAIVLAGSRYDDDAFASGFDQKHKALIPIDGKPMVQRVVEALQESKSVGHIVVVFDCLPSFLESCSSLKPAIDNNDISFVPCASSICDSVRTGLESRAEDRPFLVTTADHALITPEMIDTFCGNAWRGDADLAVALVEKKVLDDAYPHSKRTYLPFKGSKFSGANMFAFLTPNAREVLTFWKVVEQQRKKPWKLFSAFGWFNMIGLLLRRYTVDEAFVRASQVLGMRAQAVKLPFAEAAIDVDTAMDHRQVTEILEAR